jgi:hypothetical protein
MGPACSQENSDDELDFAKSVVRQKSAARNIGFRAEIKSDQAAMNSFHLRTM